MQPPPDVRTALLGSFNDFEQDIVLQILRENGIYATPKNPTTEGEHAPYPFAGMSSRGHILVDADRLDEARAIVETELAKYLDSVAADEEE